MPPKRITSDEFPKLQATQHNEVEVDDDYVAKSLATLMGGDPVEMPAHQPSPQHVSRNDMTKDDQGFTRIHDIPSKFHFYPEGAQIWVKPYAVPEIKKLTNINQGNAPDVMNDVLRRCVRGINIDELFINDRLYLVIWLRANSFKNPDFKVEYQCPLCGKMSSFHLSPDSIHVNHIDDEFTGTVVLPNAGVQVNYSYLRVRDEERIASFMTKNGREFKDMDSELLDLAAQIISVGSQKLNILTAYNFIMSLDAEDYAALTSNIEDWEFGMSPYVSAECGSCGGTGYTPVRFHASFFNPKYQPK